MELSDARICGLVHNRFSKGCENTILPCCVGDVILWLGWDHIPLHVVRKAITAGELIDILDELSTYDIIFLPSVSQEWVCKDIDIYEAVRNHCRKSKLILLAETSFFDDAAVKPMWSTIRWIRAMAAADCVIVPDPTWVKQIGRLATGPVYYVNTVISLDKIKYRRSNIGDRSGVYIVQYFYNRTGILSAMVASTISKKYSQQIYGISNGPANNSELWVNDITDYADYIGLDIFESAIDLEWTNDAKEHIGRLSEFKIAIYLNSGWESIGRNVIDCAIAGLPCVCFDKSYPARVLFPYTSVPTRDLDGAMFIADRLMSDPDFYAKVVQTADLHLSEFSYESVSDKYKRIVNSMLNSDIGGNNV